MRNMMILNNWALIALRSNAGLWLKLRPWDETASGHWVQGQVGLVGCLDEFRPVKGCAVWRGGAQNTKRAIGAHRYFLKYDLIDKEIPLCANLGCSILILSLPWEKQVRSG